MLNDDVESDINDCIEDKMNVNNAAAIYYSSQRFHLAKPSLSFIERCFASFVDSHQFLELDFLSLANILSNSELSIDSELQVFTAAYAWVSQVKERSKYEKVLLI